MFTIEYVPGSADTPKRLSINKGALSIAKDGKITGTEILLWAQQCCGLAQIVNLNYLIINTPEEADDFFKTADTAIQNISYYRAMIQFTLSSKQTHLQPLINHPKVKKVDEFNNIAHEPYNLMTIYRYTP